MGVNTTDTQVALNDSLQLLSMGIVPDSVGVSPKLLPSFKDFDDDGKRLDAAYQRQVNFLLAVGALVCRQDIDNPHCCVYLVACAFLPRLVSSKRFS